MRNKEELPRIETRLEIKNEAGSDTAELHLYGIIRQAYWWENEEECISANRVRKALQELKGKNLNIHINSRGGDVFESIAICNLLKQHNGEITVYIDALAGSGASLIITAGKKIIMYANSLQMIHKAWSLVQGNSDDLRKVADDLDKIDTAVKASYMSKFVGTEEELTKLMVDETYLTAEECLAFGLCTEIAEEVKEVQPQANVKASLFAKYSKNISMQVQEEGKKPSLFNAFIKQNQGGIV